MNYQSLKLIPTNPFSNTYETVEEDVLDEKGQKIGYLRIYLVEANEELEAYVADSRDEAFPDWLPMDVFQSMEFDYDNCPVTGKVVIFDYLRIKESLREQGIGTKIIQDVIEHYQATENFLVMKPCPIDEHVNGMSKDVERFEEEWQRLESYYTTRFGMERVITKNEYKCPIIYRKLEPTYN